jgi:hypothetical protein
MLELLHCFEKKESVLLTPRLEVISYSLLDNLHGLGEDLASRVRMERES